MITCLAVRYSSSTYYVDRSNDILNFPLATTGKESSSSVDVAMYKNHAIFTDYGGAVYYSSDYGATWTAGDTSYLVRLSMYQNYAIASRYGTQIYYSLDYGATWTAATTASNLSAASGTCILPNVTADPSSTSIGQFWFRTDV